MCWRGVTAIVLLCSPVACGGRVIEESTPDDTTTPTEMTSPPDASAPAKKPSGGGSSKNDLNGMVTLPDCALGTLATKLDQSSLPMTCPYIYSERCYTTKVKACACACPNKTGTVCSSGFPALDGTTAVSCS